MTNQEMLDFAMTRIKENQALVATLETGRVVNAEGIETQEAKDLKSQNIKLLEESSAQWKAFLENVSA